MKEEFDLVESTVFSGVRATVLNYAAISYFFVRLFLFIFIFPSSGLKRLFVLVIDLIFLRFDKEFELELGNSIFFGVCYVSSV